MTRIRARLLAACLGPVLIAASLVVTAAPASADTLASLTVTSTDQTSEFGQSVTLVAAAIGSSTTPTGTVDFFDGATLLCNNRPLTQTVAPTAAATCETSTLAVGDHSITAQYSGDGVYDPQTSPVFTQTVTRAATTTALSSSANPSVFTQSVTLTATVDTVAPDIGTPTGTVAFEQEGAPIAGCENQAMTNGVATCVRPALAVNTYDFDASYSGDTKFDVSVATPLTQTVNLAETSTALTADPDPSVFTGLVTLTATVSPDAPATGTPTGSVDFQDNGVDIPNCIGRPMTAGAATCEVSELTVASHPLTAIYNGDSGYDSSASPVFNQDVNAAATTTVVASGDTTTVVGESVTFPATITATAPATVNPSSGTVSFAAGGTVITGCATRPVAAGSSTCTTSALAVGTNAITAIYSGDTSYVTSTSPSINQTVSQASTTTGLGAAPNPSVFSGPVTLTATVAAVAPGGGTPAGAVAFKDGGVDITGCAAQALVAGVATCTASALSVAGSPHALAAVYAGNASYLTSTSATVNQTVNAASTTTVVASGDTTTVWGEPVTFTATIAATAPATVAPSAGTVSFKVGGTAITGCGTQAVAAGSSTCTTSIIPVGTNAITATYSGNTSYATSTSPSINQTVSMAGTTVELTSDQDPALAGESVTFTATVSSTAPSVGVPTGSVAFFRVREDLSREWIATVPLVGGEATATTDSLPAGANTISAVYRGSTESANSSTTLEQDIRADTGTVVTSTRNPAIAGRVIAINATVTTVVLDAGTPTGTVAFFRIRNDATREWMGNATLKDGVAKLRTGSIPVGTYTIVAVFRGGPHYTASTGTMSQTIVA